MSCAPFASRASRDPTATSCSWRQATKCSTIARPSPSMAVHGSTSAVAAIIRSPSSRRSCRRSCASPARGHTVSPCRYDVARAGRIARGDVNTRRFDVAVIGGGLVGAAIAFGLRGLGATLALLDEGDVAYRAARGNFGLIWTQGKGLGMPPYAAWTQRSAREWHAARRPAARGNGNRRRAATVGRSASVPHAARTRPARRAHGSACGADRRRALRRRDPGPCAGVGAAARRRARCRRRHMERNGRRLQSAAVVAGAARGNRARRRGLPCRPCSDADRARRAALLAAHRARRRRS